MSHWTIISFNTVDISIKSWKFFYTFLVEPRKLIWFLNLYLTWEVGDLVCKRNLKWKCFVWIIKFESCFFTKSRICIKFSIIGNLNFFFLFSSDIVIINVLSLEFIGQTSNSLWRTDKNNDVSFIGHDIYYRWYHSLSY
jgi:hypothetical protein